MAVASAMRPALKLSRSAGDARQIDAYAARGAAAGARRLGLARSLPAVMTPPSVGDGRYYAPAHARPRGDLSLAESALAEQFDDSVDIRL